MNKQTEDALKLAIEYLREYHNEMYANGFQGGYRCIEIIDACKAALESQEIGDAEIKQMLDDIEWYQQEQRKLIDRVKELESKECATNPIAGCMK